MVIDRVFPKGGTAKKPACGIRGDAATRIGAKDLWDRLKNLSCRINGLPTESSAVKKTVKKGVARVCVGPYKPPHTDGHRGRRGAGGAEKPENTGS
jgi:hypothetical protein